MLPPFSAGMIVLLFLVTVVRSHLIMTMPVPYSLDTLDNSPLLNAAPGSAGSDFPCKLRANAFDVVTENLITAGQPYSMGWSGSASHGGGTCQLSVTLDRSPTANSTFKVIDSWIGGCPTMGSDNGGTQPFNWTMPFEVPNGKATLAWSWISKLSGQPEYYMNCAPVTVSGGAGSIDDFDQLEDLFRVNLPSTDCGSQLSQDLSIPNPGKYVTTFGSTALATPTGTGCAAMGQASATGFPQASAFTDSASQVSFVFPTLSAASNTSTNAVTTTLLTSSSALVVGTVPAAAPTSTALSKSSSDSPSTSYSSGNSTAGKDACSPDGVVVCNGLYQFGLCNFGSVVYQSVAAGTACQDGKVVKKRGLHAAKHSHPHARRVW